jgi:hypothetical protein
VQRAPSDDAVGDPGLGLRVVSAFLHRPPSPAADPSHRALCPDHMTEVRFQTFVYVLTLTTVAALTVFSPDGHLFQVRHSRPLKSVELI